MVAAQSLNRPSETTLDVAAFIVIRLSVQVIAKNAEVPKEATSTTARTAINLLFMFQNRHKLL